MKIYACREEMCPRTCSAGTFITSFVGTLKGDAREHVLASLQDMSNEKNPCSNVSSELV